MNVVHEKTKEIALIKWIFEHFFLWNIRIKRNEKSMKIKGIYANTFRVSNTWCLEHNETEYIIRCATAWKKYWIFYQHIRLDGLFYNSFLWWHWLEFLKNMKFPPLVRATNPSKFKRFPPNEWRVPSINNTAKNHSAFRCPRYPLVWR